MNMFGIVWGVILGAFTYCCFTEFPICHLRSQVGSHQNMTRYVKTAADDVRNELNTFIFDVYALNEEQSANYSRSVQDQRYCLLFVSTRSKILFAFWFKVTSNTKHTIDYEYPPTTTTIIWLWIYSHMVCLYL